MTRRGSRASRFAAAATSAVVCFASLHAAGAAPGDVAAPPAGTASASASPPASASAPPPASAPAPAADARALFAEGAAHHKAGEFAAAARAYEAAWKVEPHPVYLLNAAIAYEQAKEWARAVEFYERFLTADPATTFRADIAGRLGTLRALAAVDARAASVADASRRATVSTAPAGAAAAAVPATSPALAPPSAGPGSARSSRLGLGLALGLGGGAVAAGVGVAVALIVARGHDLDRWLDRNRDVSILDQRGLWGGR